jgi:hypothetical protein
VTVSQRSRCTSLPPRLGPAAGIFDNTEGTLPHPRSCVGPSPHGNDTNGAEGARQRQGGQASLLAMSSRAGKRRATICGELRACREREGSVQTEDIDVTGSVGVPGCCGLETASDRLRRLTLDGAALVPRGGKLDPVLQGAVPCSEHFGLGKTKRRPGGDPLEVVLPAPSALCGLGSGKGSGIAMAFKPFAEFSDRKFELEL